MSAEQKYSLKRKREEQEDVEGKIARKLHHDVKEAKKAATKVKGMEIQKLVRKIKGLRKKEADVKESEAQLEILKQTEPEHIAHTALKTKILKDHTLSHSEIVQAAIASVFTAETSLAPAAAGTHEAKVHAWLLSSKVLSTEIATIVEGLKGVLNPELKVPQVAEEKPTKPSKKEVVLGDDQVPEDVEEEEPDAAGWESGSVNEDIAADAAGWESGSVPGDDSEQGSEVESDEEEEPAPKKARPAAAAATPSSKKAAESTFLPSLSVGFVRGDSDSEFSDEEAAPAPKKNRRGQRARREIWEKKYGSGANHVKKRKADEAAKPKPPPKIFRDKRAEPKQQEQAPDAGWGQRDAKPKPFTKAPTTGSSGLHPSWEAKKRLKEQQNFGIVPSQGKKITFGDDGKVAAPAPSGAISKPANKWVKPATPALHPSWEAKKKQKEKEAGGMVAPQGKKTVF